MHHCGGDRRQWDFYDAADDREYAGISLADSVRLVFGGALALVGSLCYAELATTYPRAGGDYWYLNRAYGSWAGFLFAWSKLLVIQTGSIAAIAYVAAAYASELYAFPHSQLVYALVAVIGCTIINCLGIREGKTTQNILTSAKVLGLVGITAVALFWRSPETNAEPLVREIGIGTFFIALIFVEFTYGGWNECAYIAAEVRSREKNILRSLVIGIFAVTLIYVAINAAFLWTLGAKGLSESEAAASDVLSLWFGPVGARLVSALVVVSALGAVNGYILTTARIGYALGTQHAPFAMMGKWNERLSTPTYALIAQGIVICILICSGKFEDLVMYTTPAHWTFCLMTAVALILLRYKDRDVDRPYRVHLYPIVPLIFIIYCAGMVYSGLNYAGRSSVVGFLIVFAGIPVYFLSNAFSKRPE